MIYWWRSLTTYPFLDIQLRHGPSCLPLRRERNSNGLWKVSRFFASLVPGSFQGVEGARWELCLKERQEIALMSPPPYFWITCSRFEQENQKEDCLTWWLLANGGIGVGTRCGLPCFVHIHIDTAVVMFRLICAPFGIRQPPVIDPLESPTGL